MFEQAALERFQKMYLKSKEATSLDKRRFFIRLKKFLFQQRCLTVDRDINQKL